MNEESRRKTGLAVAQPDQALVNYLDTLLAEIDTNRHTAESVPAKARPAGADTQLQEPALAETPQVVADNDECRLDRAPAWADNPFQVLRFTLQGASLAIALRELCGILPLTEPLTHLPGQPPWAMGVVLNRDAKVVVVDTRCLLMASLEQPHDEPLRPTHLLLIGEGERGLAVDGLVGTLTLEKEAVRWRGAAGSHPWYAGVIVEELSVLLDAGGVMEMLTSGPWQKENQ